MKNASRSGLKIAILLAATASSACYAQSAAGTSPPLQTGAASPPTDEIVVTATKRSERLVDVPISIVALTGDQLKNRQVATMSDLAQSVPGLTYNNNGSNQYFAIRGISNIIGNSPLVGIYIDEADATLGGYAATQINPPTYDVERVEVLRGPQGTLYGQGSAGGTIHFVTRNPELDKLGYGADVSAMFTKDGAPSGRLNAFTNIPLVNDTLAIRLSGTLEHDGGWIDQPAAGKHNINSQNLANVRLKTLWKPAPDFTATAMVIVNRDKRGADITDSGSKYDFTEAFNLGVSPRVTSNYELYNLTLAYTPSTIKILNTATYLKVFSKFANQSAFYPLLGPVSPDTPAFNYYAPLQTTRDRQFTDELRISSGSSSPWQWTVGGFYRHYRDHSIIPFNYFDFASGMTLPEPYSTDVQTVYNSGSAFVDTSYRLWDRLTIGAGVRYFLDHQDFTDGVAGARSRRTFHSVDPRFYARYKLGPTSMIYASAAKGFRSGGFNKANSPAYDPENVWTYEVGAKGEMFDRRLSFDVSLFRSDYKDYQIFGILDASTGTNYVSNLGSARIKGIEWDLTLRPTRRLRFDIGGDYLDAKFTKIDVAGAAALPGDRVNLIPKYQLTFGAQYDYSIAGKDGFVRLDYNVQGPKISRDRSIGPWYGSTSATIELLNFNSSIDLNEHLKVGIFAQNLTNEQGFTNPFAYIGNGVRPQPRTVGFNIGVKY